MAFRRIVSGHLNKAFIFVSKLLPESMENANQPALNCENCKTPLRESEMYCGVCGQKYAPGRVSLWQLINEFFSSVFSLDARFFKTTLGLLIPGKLTVEFFQGKRKPYIHPVRLFLFTALFHFALLGVGLSGLEDFTAGQLENKKRTIHRIEFAAELDTIYPRLKLAYPNRQTSLALDSLRTLTGGQHSAKDTLFILNLNLSGKSFSAIPVLAVDVFTLQAETLLDKYNIEGNANRFLTRQFIRILQKGDRFVGFLLGNLIWLVALMMPVLALLLKLLYLRRKKYLVEHLVFSFHYHAFAFVAFSIPLFFQLDALAFNGGNIEPSDRNLNFLWVVFLVVMLYLFLAMRKVYGQGLRKTFIKFSILNFSYVFIFFVSLILTLGVGALLF
jgi:hypothetical protein